MSEMRGTPYVSVIMPVYNTERYVGQAIQSILDQTFEDFELIVVDDESSDRSLSVIQSFDDPRLIVLRHCQNSGYGAAMNTGMAQAKGYYVARMDSDDLSKPDRLKAQVDFLDTYPEYVMVGTRYNFVTPRGKETLDLDQGSQELWTEQTWQMIVDGSRKFQDASVMFRAEASRQVGGYRSYQASGMDVDFWLRLLERYKKAAVINRVLYTARILPSNLSGQLFTAARNKIPRFLARERLETGTDRIMRGEPIDDLITQEMLKNAYYWHVANLWRGARLCIQARDWISAVQFMRLAIVEDRTIRSLYRLFAVLWYGVKQMYN